MSVRYTNEDRYLMELIGCGMPFNTIAALLGKPVSAIKKKTVRLSKGFKAKSRSQLTNALRKKRKAMALYA